MFNKIKKHLIEIFACMFLLLFIFWSIGYFGNALLGLKFDLASCWGGISALGGAGILASVKYCADSWKNSEDGKPL